MDPRALGDPLTNGTPTASEGRPAGAQPGDGTGGEIARLRGEIALRRARLDSAFQEIEHRVSEDLDWRRRLGAHPWLVLTAAALAGYAFGRIEWGRPRRRPAHLRDGQPTG